MGEANAAENLPSGIDDDGDRYDEPEPMGGIVSVHPVVHHQRVLSDFMAILTLRGEVEIDLDQAAPFVLEPHSEYM
jgi:hypothetical protein